MTESLYLDKVKFDPNLHKSIMAFLVNNTRLLLLLLASLLFIGFYAFSTLPREVNPEVNIPVVVISSAYPGSSPETIEDLIIRPIEDEVSSVTGIDAITSNAGQGFGSVVILFQNNVNPDRVLEQVKSKVDLVALPEDATDPSVEKIDFTNVPVLHVMLVGNIDRISLGKIAEEFRDELEDATTISSVTISGNAKERAKIDIDIKKVQELGISPSQLIQTLQGNDINFPPGEVTVNGTTYQVSIDNSFKNIEDIRKELININGQVVALSDVATIRLEADEEDQGLVYQSRGKDALTAVELRIFKTSGQAITRSADEAWEIINKKIEDYPQVELVKVMDYGEDIEDQFNELYGDLFTTICLVFIILFMFLGIRQALIASLAIPFTFFAVMIVMSITGLTLNFLSIFSLLLALGLIVDDAIVMVTAFTSYLRSGKFSVIEAGLMVYRDFKFPIYSTTITTSWAFLPLLLSTGIIGEFIRTIPIVVSTSLIVSTTIAIFVNLPLIILLHRVEVPYRVKVLVGIIISLFFVFFTGSLLLGDYLNMFANGQQNLVDYRILMLRMIFWIVFLLLFIAVIKLRKSIYVRVANIKSNFLTRFPSSSQKIASATVAWNKGFVNFAPVQRYYRRLLENILFNRRRSWLVLISAGAFLLLSFGFLVTGLVKSEFFPASDSEIIYVNIEGPSGWDRSKLTEQVDQISETANGFNEVKSITRIYGANINNEGEPINAPNYAYLLIQLFKEEERRVSSQDIAQELREVLKEQAAIKTTVINLSGGGPPAGADIQINLFGEDFVELEKLSQQFIDVINKTPGAVNASSSLRQSAGQISIDLNSAELTKRGLTAVEVASWLRIFIEGNKIGEIGTGNDTVDIVVHSTNESDITRLQNLTIPGRTGSYSLNEIAVITLKSNPESITRQDRKRTVTVTAGAVDISSTDLLLKLEPEFNNIEVPQGYSWTIGGVNEQNEESVSSIIMQMQLSFLLIMMTMVIQFNSFRKAFLVLSIIPLAVAGVFFNFAIFRIPLSFPALIGVMALFGIVIYNSILLVEKIAQNHSVGISFTEGIIDVCSTRLQPIFFTSFISIVGLLPITISDPLWRGLGGAIISGLSVSGILILFVLPVLYKFIFEKEFKSTRHLAP